MDLFDEHQRRALALLQALARGVEEGQTRRELRQRAQDLLRVQGFEGWLRPPVIHLPRLGARKLRAGDVLTLEVAPASGQAFGVAAMPVVVGGGESELAQKAALLCSATCAYASPLKTVGELFVFASAWANNRQADLVGSVVGHQALAASECPPGYPHSARLRARLLLRHRARLLHPHRIRGTWVIRPRLQVQGQVAWATAMIHVTDERRVVLGQK